MLLRLRGRDRRVWIAWSSATGVCTLPPHVIGTGLEAIDRINNAAADEIELTSRANQSANQAAGQGANQSKQ